MLWPCPAPLATSLLIVSQLGSISIPEPRQIVAHPAEVGADEAGPRVLAENVLLLAHDLLPGRVDLGVAIAIGSLDELQQPLVVLVLGEPEGSRLAGVDQDRDAQLAALGPDRIEPGVVDRNPLAGAVLCR